MHASSDHCCIVGLNTGRQDVTPCRVRGKTKSSSDPSGSRATTACDAESGFWHKNLGVSLTLMFAMRHCIGHNKWWSRWGISIAWWSTMR